jgi:hypothetical protein
MSHAAGFDIVVGMWALLLALGGAGYWLTLAWQLLTKRFNRKTMGTH